jgi:SAM-dependent methyltransferase
VISAAAVAPNPWLSIPLADYEAHMALPQVGQAELLANVLADAVRVHAPRSVAVLGCAGGNGFDRVPLGTRLVGIDVNPDYVAAARARHGARSGVELYVADVTADELPFAPVDLAYGGLLFEYVEPAVALRRLAAKLLPGAVLVAVLQLPSAAQAEVTPSPYASLAALAPSMRLVPPAALTRIALAEAYTSVGADVAPASGGKRFAVQTYRRS